jgi:thiol:disulfide interchange protein DsbD
LIDSEIQKNINEEYIFVQLYVDDKTPLALSEVHFSETLKRNLKYKGDIDAEIQLKEFNSQAQPLFVLLDKDFREISRIGYVGSVEEFRQFLSGQENK